MSDSTFSLSSDRYKRRRLVVDRRFQLRFTALVVGAAAMFAATVLADYYAYFGRNFSSNLLDPGLLHLFLAANKTLVLKFILFLAMFSGVALLMSFRVMGPLFNLRRCFAAVADGILSHRARFRKRDELHELAADFNRMVEELQRRVAQDRRTAEEMSASLQVLSTSHLDPTQKKIVEDLRERSFLLTRLFRL